MPPATVPPSTWRTSAPNGHTLLVSSGSQIVTAPHVFDTLNVDPVEALEYVAMVAEGPFVVVINPDIQPRSVADFVAWSKQHSGGATTGAPGIASTNHLAGYPDLVADVAARQAFRACLTSTGLRITSFCSYRLAPGLDPAHYAPVFDVCGEIGADTLLATCFIPIRTRQPSCSVAWPPWPTPPACA